MDGKLDKKDSSGTTSCSVGNEMGGKNKKIKKGGVEILFWISLDNEFYPD